jgi:hypothetical protein
MRRPKDERVAKTRTLDAATEFRKGLAKVPQESVRLTPCKAHHHGV